METFNEKHIEETAKILSSCSSLLVLTGAGISAESGVPTFRGEGGLWKEYRAEELATPQAFARDPELVWEWYSWRRSVILDIEPNAGHYAVAELEKMFDEFLLCTQNVDDLHRRAGSKEIVEVHGNIFMERCQVCSFKHHSVEVYTEPPLCPECGAMLRLDIVWFGEMLPADALQRSWNFASKTDCALVVGTSGVVYPAAQIPYMVMDAGGKVIEINLNATPLSSYCSTSIRGKSGIILPEIVEAIRI